MTSSERRYASPALVMRPSRVLLVIARHLRDVAVVLRDALVQPRDFAEQVADDRVGPAGQVFQRHGGLAVTALTDGPAAT